MQIIIKINNVQVEHMSCGDYITLQKTYTKRRSDDLTSNINPFSDLLFSSHWKWGSQNPPTLRGKTSTQYPVPSVKQEILLWFQNLTPKDKIACTAIHNSTFITRFLKMLPLRQPNKLFNLSEEKCILGLGVEQEDSFFNELLSTLRLACLGEPILYFSNSNIMDMRMLQWLNNVSSCKIFEYAQRGREGEQNLLWFNNSSYHYLQNWFANQLQISIIQNFFNRPQQNFYLDQFRLFLTQSGKTFELTGLELELEAANNKSSHQLAYIRSRVKEEEDKFNELKQQELIQNMEIVNQHKKRGRRRQKKKNGDKKKQEESDKDKGEEENEREDFKIVQIVNEVKIEKELFVLNQTQTLVQAQKELPEFIEGKQSPKETSPTKQEQINDERLSQIHHPKTPVKNVQTDSSYSPQKRKSSVSKNLIYVSPKRTRSPQQIRSSGLLEEGDIKQKYSEQDRQCSRIIEESSQNNFSQEITEQSYLNKRRRRKCKKQNEQFREARKNIWNRTISRQLDNLVDQLSMETNALYDLKIIAFERVRVYIQSLYPAANTVLFGSNAIGLSLPNSDVDILLYGLPCTAREEASDFLAQIAVQINAMGWVVSCSTYLNAKVPIVKLQIDPSIPFLQTKRKQDLFRVYNPMALYYLDTNRNTAGQTIKVDITINVTGVTSVGYESTQLMKEWITKMPEIQKLIILFKYILSIRSFNSNFNGGIGSYCLFAMIAAYLKSHPESEQSNLSTNFIKILKWYGEEFDNLTYVVWLREAGSCFVHEDEVNCTNDDGKKSFLRLMDPITQKMMNSSCNQYNNIKIEFRRILMELHDLENNVDEYLKENDVTTAELTKTLQTKKGLEKIVTRFENKYCPSIKAIIDRSN